MSLKRWTQCSGYQAVVFSCSRQRGERRVLRRLSVWVVGDLGRLGHLDLDGLGLVLLDLGLLGLGLLGLSPLGLGGGGGGGGGGYRHMVSIQSLI